MFLSCENLPFAKGTFLSVFSHSQLSQGVQGWNHHKLDGVGVPISCGPLTRACIATSPRPDSKLWGNPSIVSVGLRGVALASQLLCPSSMLLWISFQQGIWRWSHYKFEGVEGTHLLWGCDSDFHSNHFALIIITSLLRAPGSCGAVT